MQHGYVYQTHDVMHSRTPRHDSAPFARFFRIGPLITIDLQNYDKIEREFLLRVGFLRRAPHRNPLTLPRGRGGPQVVKCFRRPMVHYTGTGSSSVSSVSSAASLRRSIRSAWASFANSVSGCWIGFSVPMDLAYVWHHSWNAARISSRE